jgi:pyruvate/2-oxoglutarate dehydrogenase complex dihydrolipoamide dehydrogenase (E3) component
VADLATPAPDAEAARLAAVRPADWPNPSPAGRYNLVVIGGGTAGLVSAAGAAGLGARVALIERHYLGGDCLNTGCVPSKTLLRAAHAVRQVRDAETFGVRAGAPSVDFAAVMARVREVRAAIAPHDSAARFRDLGVDVYFGQAAFVARDAVEVAGERLTFHRAVIATGARPAVPPVPGLAEAGYYTSETIFDLDTLPPRLAVLGGGPVGCELAQAFQRLGARVVLIEAGKHLLPRDEADAAALLEVGLLEDGVEVRIATRVERVEHGPRGISLRMRDPGGPSAETVDAVLVAAGRVPNIDGLGLDAAGIDAEPRHGIKVDDRLRSTNPRVFAAGDVCLDARFTHAADASARVAVRNALFRGRQTVSALTLPWCTYTDPEVAQIGLTRDEARARGFVVDEYAKRWSEVDRGRTDGVPGGFVRILTPRGKDRILGATIVGPHAGDLICEVAVAMAAGVGLGRLSGVVHPYPSYAEAIRQLGDTYQRTRLTPRVRDLMARWLAWQRR